MIGLPLLGVLLSPGVKAEILVSGIVQTDTPVTLAVEGYRAMAAGSAGLYGEHKPEVKMKTQSGTVFRLPLPEAGMWILVVRASGFVPMMFPLMPATNHVALPPLTLSPSTRCDLQLRGDEADLKKGLVFVQSDGTPRSRPVQSNRWSPWRPPVPLAGRRQLSFDRAHDEALRVTAFVPPGRVVEAGCGDTMRWTLGDAAPPSQWRQLLTADGKAVVNAAVELGGERWPAGRTDHEGRILLPRTQEPLWLITQEGFGNRFFLTGDGEADAMVPQAVIQQKVEALQVVGGRVVEAETGAPVAAAIVWIDDGVGSRANRLTAPPQVRPDEDGGFQLPLPQPPVASLRGGAAGFLSASLPLSVFLSRRFLALPPATTLQGTVINDRQDSVAGAYVVASSLDPRAARNPARVPTAAYSDAEGHFAIHQIEKQVPLMVTAQAPGYLKTTVRSEDTSENAVITMVLRRPARVTGIAVDPGGVPVAAAEVALVRRGSDERFAGPPSTWPESARLSEVTITDAAGRFAVPAREVAADLVVSSRSAGIGLLRDLRPTRTQPLNVGTVTLRAYEVLSGMVTDSKGRPLGGAEVVYGRPVPSMGSPQARIGNRSSTVTSAEGLFVIQQFSSGDSVHLFVDKEGFVPKTVPGVPVPSPEPVEIALDPGLSLRGAVEDSQGRGIEDVTIVLESPTPESELQAHVTRSLYDGTFSFSDIAPGSFNVRASAAGYQRLKTSITVTESTSQETLTLTLPRADAQLVGRVTVLEEPLSGAQVSDSFGATAVTKPDGSFVLSTGAGDQWFEARHPRHDLSVTKKLDLQRGENQYDFDLTLCSIEGKVVASDGLLLPGAEVRLWQRIGSGDYRSTTTEDATFQMEVPAGTYQLSAIHEGYAAKTMEVDVRGEPQIVEVELAPQAAIVGSVTGLERDELTRLQVSASRGPLGGGRPRRVGEDGRFRLEGLSSGLWRVTGRVLHSDKTARQNVTIEPHDRTVQVDLEFAPGFVVAGRVVAHDLSVVAKPVYLYREAEIADFYETLTDYSGRFVFQGLVAGEYSVAVGNQIFSVDVPLEGELDIALELGSLGVAILDKSTGTGIGSCTGRLYPSTIDQDIAARLGLLRTIVSPKSGVASLRDVEAGSYRLDVACPGYRPRSLAVTVQPSESSHYVLTTEPRP